MKKILFLLCLAAGIFASPVVALAEEPANSKPKPFAEKRVVLQISDDSSAKQTLILNVASNLIKHYGPDKVDVEIVAFGPGLRLLFAGNANEHRVAGLAETSGVRFAACSNTMTKMSKILGELPELTVHSNQVQAGVVRIIDLVDQGYVLVKP